MDDGRFDVREAMDIGASVGIGRGELMLECNFGAFTSRCGEISGMLAL